MSRVLIVGNLADNKWIGNLIYRVKQADPSIVIDCFWSKLTDEQPCNSSNHCTIIHRTKRHHPSFLYHIPKLRIWIKGRDVTLSFKEFINERLREGIHYNLVNYHYLGNETLKCWGLVYKIADKTLLMPWGSDVLRRSKGYSCKMKEYVQHYDYVATSDNPRFKKELTEKISVREEQFVDLDFGSESIDRLIDKEDVSRELAKESLGVRGKFIITVGYNAHEEQRHVEVIDAIASIKDRLPKNLLLVFPMTYGGKQQVNLVKNRLLDLGLDYLLFDKYLTYQEIVDLRKCSDVFIHAQTTDANSASLAEYLFCRSTVINASWLKYEHFEQYGKPYYLFNDFRELPSVLEMAIQGGSLVNDELVEYLRQFSWSYKIHKWLTLFNGQHF